MLFGGPGPLFRSWSCETPPGLGCRPGTRHKVRNANPPSNMRPLKIISHPFMASMSSTSPLAYCHELNLQHACPVQLKKVSPRSSNEPQAHVALYRRSACCRVQACMLQTATDAIIHCAPTHKTRSSMHIVRHTRLQDPRQLCMHHGFWPQGF